MTTTDTEARIYCGTYAKYNSGSISGKWITLSDYSDRDEAMEACLELHKDEADPELMFQDFEGFPRCWYSESSLPPAILWEWLELDETERAAFGIYADNLGGGVEVADFRDAYVGIYDSGADYAEQTAEDCGDIPKDMPSWIVIDWQASWDCNLRHDYFTGTDDEGNMHFFRNC